MSLLLTISLRLSLGTTIVIQRAFLALLLLLSLELLIIDSNSVVHIGIKCLSVTIGLNKLVFDVVLKSIIEVSFKRVRSLIDPKSKLLESRSILDS